MAEQPVVETWQPANPPTRIIDCGLVKKMTTVVESPVDDLNRIPGGTIWPSVAPAVLKHIRDSRTTLVFVNTRRMAERASLRGHDAAAERYQHRARELDQQAQQVRNLVLTGVGAADEESTPEETPEEP